MEEKKLISGPISLSAENNEVELNNVEINVLSNNNNRDETKRE